MPTFRALATFRSYPSDTGGTRSSLGTARHRHDHVCSTECLPSRSLIEKPVNFLLPAIGWAKSRFFGHRRSTALRFASEIKALVDVPGVDFTASRPNLAALFLGDSTSLLQRQRTAASIPVEAGTFGIFRIGREPEIHPLLGTSDHWRDLPTVSSERIALLTQRDSIEQFDPVSLRTCRSGCFLSGGVDSSLVAYGIRNLRSRSAAQRRFLIGFDEPGYDESVESTRR